MRKVNWIIGSIALALGIGVGMLSIALASNPIAPSLLAKMNLHKQASPLDPSVTAGAAANRSATGNGSITTDGNATGADKPLQDGSAEAVSPLLAQQIVGDYKQDIGFFFDAWKSTDMTTYRSKVIKAYTGDLLERHARQAEEYILQGVGLDVSLINFDNVVVETADAGTATLRADYRYVASDFVLNEGKTVGTPNEHIVHVRVNLIKSGGRWVITGETGIGA